MNFLKPVLVTGGAGFVGTHLTRRLIEMGYSVRVLDDLSTGQLSPALKNCDLFKGDIRDPLTVRTALKGCGTVFHLAARVELAKSWETPADCLSVNTTGTAVLLKESVLAGVDRWVFASSSAVYPLTTTGALKEFQAGPGETPYGISKSTSEQLIAIFARQHHLSYCNLRFFNIFGPGQNFYSPYSAVIPRFLNLAQQGEPLTIFGSGNQLRDFIHITDTIDAYILAAQSSYQGSLNVGTGIGTSVLDVARAVCRYYPNASITHLAPRPGDAQESCSDISQTHRVLNFYPKISFEKGLKNLIDSYFEPTLHNADVSQSL